MKQPKRELVIVGMSGGVDSAVAAHLLQKQGFEVRAVFMKNFSERISSAYECPWKEDRKSAYAAAAHLGIPIETWNFQKEYKKTVLDYMIAEYRAGRTPNPDIMCNRYVKFDVFSKRALAAGAAYIATGHYAGIRRDSRGMCHLLKGADTSKDQSYFLARVAQSQLSHVMFPLADMKKSAVRTIAKRIRLPNAARPDSQGICFVGTIPLITLLKKKIKPRRGSIVDTSGNVIGHHEGVWYYTIGQRKGIQVGGGPALYVVDKETKRNRLIVGPRNDSRLLRHEVRLSEWQWVVSRLPVPLRCGVKIRYRQDDQRASLTAVTGGRARIRFNQAQWAVAPGQIAVCYRGREAVGSGVID